MEIGAGLDVQIFGVVIDVRGAEDGVDECCGAFLVRGEYVFAHCCDVGLGFCGSVEVS